MPVLAEKLDAIVGVNTHHGTHEVQIASPTGTPIATVSIDKDSSGHTGLLTWITMHAPGPRLAVLGEGTSNYATELARAVAAVGMMVIECNQSDAEQRRGKDRNKNHSGPIDVHCATLTASHLGTGRLPAVGANGDHDALRILLNARQDLTATTTEQSNRLRALLLGGDETDRKIARGAFTEVSLASLARRKEPRNVTRKHSVRYAEIRRLALSLFAASRELKANTMQLQAIVDDLAPGLTDRRGIGPVGAAQAIVSLSYPSAVPRQRGARAVRIQFDSDAMVDLPADVRLTSRQTVSSSVKPGLSSVPV